MSSAASCFNHDICQLTSLNPSHSAWPSSLKVLWHDKPTYSRSKLDYKKANGSPPVPLAVWADMLLNDAHHSKSSSISVVTSPEDDDSTGSASLLAVSANSTVP